MAKKMVAGGRAEKRAKRRVVASPPAPAEAPAAVPATSRPGAVRSTWMAPARSSGRNAGVIRDEDYRYIYGDLRRIGILAGTGFAALIVLSFVLR